MTPEEIGVAVCRDVCLRFVRERQCTRRRELARKYENTGVLDRLMDRGYLDADRNRPNQDYCYTPTLGAFVLSGEQELLTSLERNMTAVMAALRGLFLQTEDRNEFTCDEVYEKARQLNNSTDEEYLPIALLIAGNLSGTFSYGLNDQKTEVASVTLNDNVVNINPSAWAQERISQFSPEHFLREYSAPTFPPPNDSSDPFGREEVETLPTIATEGANDKESFDVKQAVDTLLQDDELRSRVRDLLAAPRHYDRAVREATTVLDDRLKRLTGIRGMRPGDLVGKVLNPDPAKAVLLVSPEAYEQQGFHNMCSGVMLAFRDSTHHKLSDNFTQADALKFCGLIDMLLTVIGKGVVYADRI